MAHIRTQQRASIKAMLAGSPDAAGRVLVRRGLPLQKDFQPTFLVSFQNERSEDVSMGGAQLRTLEVRVTACVKGDSEAGEDTLDRMALWAEERFAANPTLGGLAETYAYQSTEYGFFDGGEATLCTAAITFVAQSYTRRDDPENTL